MKALITGASSGIGRDMARYLSTLGYDIIAVAQNEERLKELQIELKTNVQIIYMDLSKKENCIELYEKTKNENIDILVNNAGFGIFGFFDETDLEREISLIDTNVTAVHILTKLFLKDMVKKDSGRILNVSSIASFAPGPLMAAYYSSKAYVTSMTKGIYRELKKKKSNVHISLLCPGPVATNFNNVAGVHFSIKELSSQYVAKYAIDKTLKNKLVIVPGFLNKIIRILSKIAPSKLASEVVYHNQTRKNK
ncbi:MAG: SDR family oxidoreductase [Clostridia bacterium]|nr:SDR family oxidoreductase [Clostridia bacterium]